MKYADLLEIKEICDRQSVPIGQGVRLSVGHEVPANDK